MTAGRVATVGVNKGEQLSNTGHSDESGTAGSAERRTPPLLWLLILLGIVCVVVASVLQRDLVNAGRLPSEWQITAVSLFGSLGGPLLIAGLVGLVLARLGVGRRI